MIVTPFQYFLYYLAKTHVQLPVFTLGMVSTRYVPVCTKYDFSVSGIAVVIPRAGPVLPEDIYTEDILIYRYVEYGEKG